MGQCNILFFVACLVVSSFAAVPFPTPLSQEMIDFINNYPDATWKAGKTFEGRSIEHVKGLCGVIENNDVKLPTMTHDIDENEVLPESFDLRDKSDMCPTLKEIRDQGSCGSCWAFGAVSTMSDRICLASNGAKKVHLGAEDLLSCCHICGFGCHGGIPAMAWMYYRFSGIVTGGAYNSSEGCRPYTIPTCEHHSAHNGTRPPCGDLVSTPSCTKKCISGYEKQYNQDRHYGYFPYFVSRHEDQIKKELMNHGSIQAAFQVYEDFASYQSGIYKHISGSWLGGHAVKIIGWGAENNIPYWTVANSWNSDWGENGFFRILRGKNMCGIESHLIAGLPNLNY